MTGPDQPKAAASEKQPGGLAPGAASSVDSPATAPSGGTTDASHQTPTGATDLASKALQEPTGPGVAAVGLERTGMFGVQGSGDTSGFGLLVSAPYAPAPAERPFGGPRVRGAKNERSSGSDSRGEFDEVADALAAAMVGRSIPASALLQTTVANNEITFYF